MIDSKGFGSLHCLKPFLKIKRETNEKDIQNNIETTIFTKGVLNCPGIKFV